MPAHLVRLHSDPNRTPAAELPEPPVLKTMPGAACSTTWHGHHIHYRQMGTGPVLLLVHMVDIGASCLEWHRNIEPLSSTFNVMAVDLPGFGLSDVRPEPYTAETYVRFLCDFLHEVAPGGAHVIGSGLGASYLTLAAVRCPNRIHRMMLVAPGGLSALRPSTIGGLTFQMLGWKPFHSAMTDSAASRVAIQEHLKHDLYSDELLAGDPEVDARFWIAHRRNADYVERSRIAGRLNADIRAAVKQLTQPVLVAWGRRATKPPVSDAELFCERNPKAEVVIFEKSSLVPYEEETNKFNQVAANFLAPEAFISVA